MPFAKEHRARQANPDQFAFFRRTKPAGFPDGVESIIGVKKDDTEETQSIAFDATQWSAEEAKKWLVDNDFNSAQFEEAKGKQDGKSIRLDDLSSGGATMRRRRRWDVMPLSKPELTSTGFVRAQGMITRSGVFTYNRLDGTSVRELRAPDEVFREDSLRSFAGMPMTIDHPPENLTPKTAMDFAVGSVSNPVRVGNHVRADLTILRKDAIDAVMSQGKNKLSCGYECTVIDRGGTFVHADGTEERFDAIQTGIDGNHVAICDNPRAGPSAQIRVDEADAYADIPAEQQPKGDSMEVEITINGQTYKVSQAAADRMRADGLLDKPKDPPKKVEPKKDESGNDRALREVQEERDTLRGEKAALQAKLDSQEKDGKEKKARSDAKTATKQRVELCAIAAGILEDKDGKQMKLDAVLDMDDLDIMKAVIAKLEPEMKVDGEGEAFLRGVFKTLTSTRIDTAKEIQKLVNQGRQTGAENRDDEDNDAEKRADAAREGMKQGMKDGWKSKEMLAQEKDQRERMKQ